MNKKATRKVKDDNTDNKKSLLPHGDKILLIPRRRICGDRFDKGCECWVHRECDSVVQEHHKEIQPNRPQDSQEVCKAGTTDGLFIQTRVMTVESRLA